MNRREMFTRLMNHEEVGHVLIDHGKQVGSIHKSAYPAIREVMGLPPVEQPVILDRMSQCVKSDEDLLQAWNVDFRWLAPKWVQVTEVDEKSYRNWLGTKFSYTGDYYAIADAPCKHLSLDEINSYPWPDTADPGIVEGLKAEVEYWHSNTDYIIGADGIKGGILQNCLEVRGYDQFFMDFILDPELTHRLLDIMLELYKDAYTLYLNEIGEYAQILYLTDDFGAQNALLISPAMWREFIKPREAELIRHIKGLAPHIKVMFHTDGSVLPIIEEMVEMGVDILNPVQTSVEELKDTAKLNETVGEKICFHGAMDVQNVLINATPDEVKAETARRMKDLGTGGGYIISTCHNINKDIPPENLKIMFETINTYGTYPLNVDELLK